MVDTIEEEDTMETNQDSRKGLNPGLIDSFHFYQYSCF